MRIDSYLDEGGFFSSMAQDVREGLTRPGQKKLLPKYFYDAHGSDLFEQITELREYYPMRQESALLIEIAPRIMASLSPAEVVELGSGSSTKTRILLDAQDSGRSVSKYVPMDVSESIVRLASEELQARYPGLEIHGVIGDFEKDLDRIPPRDGQRLVLFLGSTIGNLEPEPRVELLRSIARLLGPDDHLLLGTDLVKDIDVIERAYNDAAGVTAAFNLNVLNVINQNLDANFDVDAFQHTAFFNHDLARIEMHLRALRDCVVDIGGCDLTVKFAAGETIWTESSHKFTRESVGSMLSAAGLKLDEWYVSEAPQYALSLASLA